MTTLDYRAEAAAARKRAGVLYRRSTADAREAARYYELARVYERQARWLTGYPELWAAGREGVTPARSEGIARQMIRLADSYGRGVFMNAEHSRLCRERARTWDSLAAQREYREATAGA